MKKLLCMFVLVGLFYQSRAMTDVLEGTDELRNTTEIFNYSNDGKSQNIDQNKKQDALNRALLQAAINHDIEAARLALERGALINCVNKHGTTPLMFACIFQQGIDKTKHLALVEYFINAGAEVNTNNLDDRSALLEAAATGPNVMNYIVQRLLLAGADTGAFNIYYRTAVMHSGCTIL